MKVNVTIRVECEDDEESAVEMRFKGCQRERGILNGNLGAPVTTALEKHAELFPDIQCEDCPRCEGSGAHLSACPFCGGEPKYRESPDGGHFVECPACQSSSKLIYPSKTDPKPLLTEAWNSRAERYKEALIFIAEQGCEGDTGDYATCADVCPQQCVTQYCLPCYANAALSHANAPGERPASGSLQPDCSAREKRLLGLASFWKTEAQQWRKLFQEQRGGATFDAIQKEVQQLRAQLPNAKLTRGENNEG